MEIFEQDKADTLIPTHMHGALKRWINEGIWPGSFLTAVLQNDLKEAFGRADSVNTEAMPNWMCFLYNYAPSQCWGSVEKTEQWAVQREAERVRNMPVKSEDEKK